jgi:hypothetical protein
MEPAAEGVKDGENILGEFLLGAVVPVVENHEFPTVALGHPLDDLESEAGQPVPVGNHNAELIALV